MLAIAIIWHDGSNRIEVIGFTIFWMAFNGVSDARCDSDEPAASLYTLTMPVFDLRLSRIESAQSTVPQELQGTYPKAKYLPNPPLATLDAPYMLSSVHVRTHLRLPTSQIYTWPSLLTVISSSLLDPPTSPRAFPDPP